MVKSNGKPFRTMRDTVVLILITEKNHKPYTIAQKKKKNNKLNDKGVVFIVKYFLNSCEKVGFLIVVLLKFGSIFTIKMMKCE